MNSNAPVSALLDPSFFAPTSLIQLYYGVWTVLTTVGIGLTFGFSAVAIPQLKEAESSIQVTTREAAWIASVLLLASPVGCLVSGYFTDRVGRRSLLIWCQMPMCLGWLIIACAQSAKFLIIGRTLTGFGYGMSIIPPQIYMSEFSLPNMRGVIGAVPNFAMGVGITIEAFLGSFCSWRFLCWIGVIYTLLLFSLNFLLPESPYFHLLKGNINEAKESLKKFRSKNYDIESEITNMIDYKRDNDIRRLTIKQLIPALCQPSSCKPFWIINAYQMFGQLAGVSVITFWAVDILKDAQGILDPTLGNIVLSAARMVFGLLCSILLYRIGRRPLTFISGFGTGMSFILLGLHNIYFSYLRYFPFVCCVSYISFASLGLTILPLMLMSEMYPLQVRGILSGITVSLTNIIMFFCNKFYPYVKNTWGFSYTVIAMGSCALVGVVFLWTVLPETKDLTVTEIEEYFNGRIATPLSQRALQLSAKRHSEQSEHHTNLVMKS